MKRGGEAEFRGQKKNDPSLTKGSELRDWGAIEESKRETILFLVGLYE